MNTPPAQRRTKTDRRVVAFAERVLRYRWAVIVVALILCGILGSYLPHFVFNDNYRSFFDEDNPDLIAFDRVKSTFSDNDTIFFVFTPASGNVFNKDDLKVLRELTERAWTIPGALRVDSPTNYQYSYAEGDDLFVESLVPEIDDLTEADLARIEETALGEEMLVDRLINADATVAGVNILARLDGESTAASAKGVFAAREIQAAMREKYPEVEIGLTGIMPLNQAFLEAAEYESKTFIPLMLAIVFISMVILLRSLALALATVTVIVASTVCAIGLAIALGIEFAGPSLPSPLMILTLAVADSVHILISNRYFLSRGYNKHDALVESLRVNVQPVFLTSFTTAIGFLSMNLNIVPPIADLGNITALGVSFAFLFSVTLLPALVSLLPANAPVKPMDATSPRMSALADFTLRYRRPLLAVFVVTTVVAAACIPRIPINNQFINWFDKSMPIRHDTDYAMENLTGIYVLTYVFPAEDSGGIAEPEYLKNLDRFAEWIRTQDGVVHVNHIGDVLKRLNQSMHGGDPDHYTIPEERELAAQYLLLYEMSLPAGLDLNTQIDLDKRSTRVDVTVANLKSEGIQRIRHDSNEWIRSNLPDYMQSDAMGMAVMFATVTDQMMTSLIRTTPIAMGMVSIVMLFVLRSTRFGLLSLVPNFAPLIVTFGVWGMLEWEVNFSMTSVTAMGMGIIVDDTVHFMSKYLRARREEGLSPEDSVRFAFRSVGKALWVTSTILVAGFGALSLSLFLFNQNMGTMTAMVILFALGGDLLFLPALLVTFDHGKSMVTTSEEPVEADA